MKILMISPDEAVISGNKVDTERITGGLRALGHEVRLNADSADFKPDIVHIFNAYKSRHGVDIAMKSGAKLVVSMTGTDYNIYAHLISEVLESADATVFFCMDAVNAVRSKINLINPCVIKRGMLDFKETNFRLKGKFVFSHIASIRRVKNNLFPIRPLSRLRKKYDFMLYFIGPVIENDYFNEFKSAISGKDWINYIGVVPREDIKGVYLSTDVVLNTSLSEGSSNVICEAHNLGRTVLASDIDGNRPLEPLLYKDDADFYNEARKCIEVRRVAGKYCGNKHEIGQYDVLYKSLIKGHKGTNISKAL
ncbi:glycosyltransferase family 4 protein [Candidatus Woesearchaeota archaeon]|nr:glycosyltransferase family 4 protein [Candidatus Woesearchaeota archaeon]